MIVLRGIERIDYNQPPSSAPQRRHGNRRQAVIGADFENVAGDSSMLSGELIVRHEQQSRVVLKPSVDSMESGQIFLEKAGLHESNSLLCIGGPPRSRFWQMICWPQQRVAK